MTDELIVDRCSDVIRLKLNRPERANALSPELVERLHAEFADLGVARCVVLSGEGTSFCSGFDLSDIGQLSDADLLWRFVRIEQLLQVIFHAPVPVLGLAHGHAVGAGADLLASASVRVVAPGTRLRMPGLNFGLVLGTRRLAQRVGSAIAQDLLVDTRTFDADEAQAIGLVQEIAGVADWPEVIERTRTRARALTATATAAMLEATRTDTRAGDMAALVRSAAVPGLKDRVEHYVQNASKPRSRS